MDNRPVSSTFLRFQMAAAITLVLLAAFGSWLISSSFGANVVSKTIVADALDDTQIGVVDLRTEFLRLTLAKDVHKAGIVRGEMRRALRTMTEGSAAIAAAAEAGDIGPATMAIIGNASLYPLERLAELEQLARDLVGREAVFGDAAVRIASVGFEASNHLLPLLKRMNDTERDAQRRAAASLSDSAAIALALSISAALATALLIFLPMERRVLTAQAELEERRRSAERASEAKTQFLATMSHEIRTPMNGVLGMADVLKTTALTPEQRKMLDVITGSGAALVQLIDAVLDLSKIEAGRFEIAAHPFDLRRVCEEVTMLFSGAAAAKGVAMICDVEAAVAASYSGDGGAVRQALSNLVGNAVKFTDKGEIRLTARTAPEGIALSVADTGAGVPQDAQARIFESFEQADSTTTRRYGGTGLGLAIVKRLTEAMGGSVSLDSAPGRGSTFTLRLPLASAEPESPRPPAAAATASATMARRVLLAEDNEVNQFIFCAMMRRVGCEVTVAADGRAAVDAFTAAPFDIVLMDVSMPVMDGYEATRAIRAIERRTGAAPTPILGLSAHAMSEHRNRAIAADMTDFLTKPISAEALHGALARHAGGDAPTPGSSLKECA